MTQYLISTQGGLSKYVDYDALVNLLFNQHTNETFTQLYLRGLKLSKGYANPNILHQRLKDDPRLTRMDRE